MSATVADVLALDALLESLPDLERASILRAMESRGYGNNGPTSYDVRVAREQGYDAGLAAGRAEKKTA